MLCISTVYLVYHKYKMQHQGNIKKISLKIYVTVYNHINLFPSQMTHWHRFQNTGFERFSSVRIPLGLFFFIIRKDLSVTIFRRIFEKKIIIIEIYLKYKLNSCFVAYKCSFMLHFACLIFN